MLFLKGMVINTNLLSEKNFLASILKGVVIK